MRQQQHLFGVLICTTLVTVALVGCDLINPSAKNSKKDVKKEAETQAGSLTQNASNQPLPKDVIVKVGNWTLTTKEFDERLKLLKQGLPEFNDSDPNSKALVLDELIRQQLLVQDAENSGIAKQKDITDAVEDFRRTLLVQELANKLTKDVLATEEDAQKYYTDNKELFVEPVEWSVREIVSADEATAKNILVQVLQGSDFAELAKTQSKGTTAADGGLLKPFTKAPFEAMQIAIATLDVGATSAVIKGPQGFYVFKVEGKKGGQPKEFKEVKDELISGLTVRKQQEAISEHLNAIAQKTKIEVNKDLLGAVEPKK